MMKQLDTDDFGLEDFKMKKSVKVLKTNDDLESNRMMTATLGETDLNDGENFEKIVKNLTKMSKKEKLAFHSHIHFYAKRIIFCQANSCCPNIFMN